MSDQEIEKKEAKLAAAKMRYDNLGVDIETNKVRMITKGNSKRVAEEFSEKFTALNGNEKEFFVEVPTGTYRNGDTYEEKNQELSFFRDQRTRLADSIEECIGFLNKANMDIRCSPDKENGGAFSHLNVRLLLQVHITNLIERSSDYDRSMYALIEAQRNSSNKKGKK